MATLSAVIAEGGSGCLTIRSSGGLTILDGEERDLTPRGRKPRAVLAYLSTRSDHKASRETLMDLLWGNRGEAQARASLRQAMLEIRHACGNLVRGDREHVWLDGEFVVEDGEADPSAAFADLNHITPQFDEWLRGERARRTDATLQSLRCEIEQLLARDRGPAAAPLIERMRALDPYNEDWLRLAMQADYQAAQAGAIEKHFKDMQQALKRDLGVEPAAETRALRDRLLRELTREPKPAFSHEAPISPVTPPAAAQSPRWRYRLAVASLVVATAAGGLLYKNSAEPAIPPRLAVLPFAAGAGVDPALAEGLSDELHGQLARNGEIRVIGRTSAAQFKGKAADLRDVGRKLDAGYIVEGTVRRSDGRVSIFVSLVRSRDGSTIWLRNFAGASDQLASVATTVGNEINRSLGATSLPAPKSRTSGEAYSLYLQAKALLRNRESDDSNRAAELLRQATRIDANFAGAWAQLAAAAHLTGKPYVELSDGTKISKRDAVVRALRLDPNLAEAHAIAWLVDGGNGSTEATRAHLRRALRLDPRDSQTLYWWAGVLRGSGHYQRSAAIGRRVAEMDPLWKRPVSAAMEASLVSGDRAAALEYLKRIKAGNPRGAEEVEVSLAFYDGDYSRVVELAFAGHRDGWDDGKAIAAYTLAALGFEREAALIVPYFGPFERAIWTGRVPPLPAIREKLTLEAAKGNPSAYSAIIWALARERRWSDIAAIYDLDLGPVRSVRDNDPGGRVTRVFFGPMLALSLHKAGRKEEAARLALASDAAARVILGNGMVPPSDLHAIAGSEAILGRRESALAHLERAFATGWRLDGDVHSRLADNPVFAVLRGDPRFERLRQIQERHFAKERREIMALGII